jgi:hypothetical protein
MFAEPRLGIVGTAQILCPDRVKFGQVRRLRESITTSGLSLLQPSLVGQTVSLLRATIFFLRARLE